MAHRGGLDALDRALRDIRDSQAPMGSATLLLSGTRADEVQAYLKSTPLWRHVTILTLSTNTLSTRLYGDRNSSQFAKDILELGDGKMPLDAAGELDITLLCTIVSSINELKDKVFPNLQDNYYNLNWLCERTILAPKNLIVSKLNDQLLHFLPGNHRTFKSIDSMIENNAAVNYPTEFLNSLEPPCLPPHTLQLKEGIPIMLLQNLEPPKLCNGTRLVVRKVLNHVIEAAIISGSGKADDVFIPRVPLISSGAAIPFSFRSHLCYSFLHSCHLCYVNKRVTRVFSFHIHNHYFSGNYGSKECTRTVAITSTTAITPIS
uniref:ATP-dependent DNA helicase n=1 Tax=Octopus bimaculoides TaxID=37653 RepID=A0A0L8H5K9_OCTBM